MGTIPKLKKRIKFDPVTEREIIPDGFTDIDIELVSIVVHVFVTFPTKFFLLCVENFTPMEAINISISSESLALSIK